MKDIRYYYDAAGKPVAIRAFTRTSSTANFTDTIYYLQTNLQGDVVGIYNASGTKIYEYAYDAWGNIIKSAQVADGGSDAHAVNPFRYRRLLIGDKLYEKNYLCTNSCFVIKFFVWM